jgi:hypothetical protein
LSSRKSAGIEKLKPTYPLKEMKKLIKENRTVPPGIKVVEGANELGYTIFEAHQIILELETADFIKSRTQVNNNKIWQDSYIKEVKGKRIYIKFKKFKGNFFLTSFKPDESGGGSHG